MKKLIVKIATVDDASFLSEDLYEVVHVCRKEKKILILV